jgi:hypothetical protein
LDWLKSVAKGGKTMADVDRFGFRNEEHVFHRYFPRYTVSLRYCPELFNLIERNPDQENPRTISSNINVVFAILRYQEMVEELVNLQAVSQIPEKIEKIRREVSELREIIDSLEHIKYIIAHDPEKVQKVLSAQEKILNLNHFRDIH